MLSWQSPIDPLMLQMLDKRVDGWSRILAWFHCISSLVFCLHSTMSTFTKTSCLLHEFSFTNIMKNSFNSSTVYQYRILSFSYLKFYSTCAMCWSSFQSLLHVYINLFYYLWAVPSILCPKKVYPLMFDNNFGKCGPICNILSPTDSWENSLCIYTKTSTSPAICCYTTSWNLKIQKCYWFWQQKIFQFHSTATLPLLWLYTVYFLPLETNYPLLAYEQPQNSPVSPPEQKSISPFSRMP